VTRPARRSPDDRDPLAVVPDGPTVTPEEQALEAGLRGLAGMLLTQQSAKGVLANVTSLAAESLPGCEAASISLIRNGRPTTPVCSAEMAEEVDGSQYETGEGPCLQAAATGVAVRVDSFETEDRWPAFARKAVAHGVLSSLSIPLSASDEILGALNLYSSQPANFVDAEENATMFARQASITLMNASALERAQELAEQLALALESRDVIGQAKGILMAREALSPEQAFDVLRRASQRTNRKLHDVAREVVSRGAPHDEGPES
jgi:GAF domain-containing protein